MKRKKSSLEYRILSSFLAFILIFTFICPPNISHAQSVNLLNLPIPGTMVNPSSAYTPILLKGMTVHPEDPLKFDFIVDSGDEDFDVGATGQSTLQEESQRLIKYFLASLTVPKYDLWVNLSPYESDRIIPEELGKTELGRDLLALDYVLKQLTASLMYPEDELGNDFWEKIYKKAQEEYGTTEIPVNTFNKVWILPEKATVYEHENTVYVVDSKLKVMLDEDYLAMEKNQEINIPLYQKNNFQTKIIREIILPAIEKEVNEGEHFAKLRQIYHSLILAKWYKETLRASVGAYGHTPSLLDIYIDQNKVAGIENGDATVNNQIYDRYMQAFKKGVFNFIKEDYDRLSGEKIPRKYFSGGIPLAQRLDIRYAEDGNKVANSTIGKKLTKVVVEIDPQNKGESASPIFKSYRINRNISRLKTLYRELRRLEREYKKKPFEIEELEKPDPWIENLRKTELSESIKEREKSILDIENKLFNEYGVNLFSIQKRVKQSNSLIIVKTARKMIKDKLAEKYPDNPEYVDLISEGNIKRIIGASPTEEIEFDVLYHDGEEKGDPWEAFWAGFFFYGYEDDKVAPLEKMLSPERIEIIFKSSSPISFNNLSNIPTGLIGVLEEKEQFLSSSSVKESVDDNLGGIDLNDINVNRQGSDTKIQFDSSAMEPLLNMNIEGFVPIIINITPLPSVLPLLGLEPGKKDEDKPLERCAS